MCGIAGIITSPHGRKYAQDLLPALKLMTHRGPDDFGILCWDQGTVQSLTRDTADFRNTEVVFLHRRLSILDLNPSGWQPMGTSDGLAFISFNGEIYNYLELKKQLESLGHTFVSQSDTEVLLRSYLEWGINFLERLVGMFSFALLDTRQRKVFVVRDFFGIKPLFYMVQNHNFAFCSEIAPLLNLSNEKRLANAKVVSEYASYGTVDHGKDTFFRGIHRVLPGHYLEVSLDKPDAFTSHQYWAPDLSQKIDLSFDAAAVHLRELFIDSVGLHLRSDVPIAAMLSGGIDSSSIVMAMTKILGSKKSLNIFSYIASEKDISEEAWVDIVAKAAGSDVHKVRINAEDVVTDLKELIRAQQEPFGSTSIYAQYKIFQAMKARGLKVSLGGQGADELLAGYRRYGGGRLASLIKKGDVLGAAKLFHRLSALPNSTAKANLSFFVSAFFSTSVKNMMSALIGDPEIPPFLDKAWVKTQSIHMDRFPQFAGSEVMKQMLSDALTTSNLPQLLRYEDRNAMAFSVENRVPFITPRIADFLFSLPEHYLLSNGGTSKHLFREAMRGIVPDVILDRRDKIGFSTPERVWLMQLQKWVDDLFADPELGDRLPFLNVPHIRADWQQFKRTGQRFDWRFWRWINLIEWSREWNVDFK